ncbi:MAG TPA: DNA cytosine methyltransferase [Terriglobales bacterium]
MRIISLFSGAGGLDLGLKRAGHAIVWANDHDRDCVETYKQNVGRHIFLGDIDKVKLKDIPDGEVLVGGFPCQGFSCANLLRHAADERNALYLQFLRILKGKKPPFFVAENVRGLLSLDEGKIVKMIVNDFFASGYEVKYDTFNMADFGVPQNRFRVIILGMRKDLPSTCFPSFPSQTHARKSSNGFRPWLSIGKALQGIPEPTGKHNLFNHICSKYKVTNRNFTGHRRTDPTKPSPTILARGNGKGGVCAIQHPRNHRRLSVRESALIQTFPLEFKFSGTLNSMYRQVGNAVPPTFGELLGNELKKVERKLKGK